MLAILSLPAFEGRECPRPDPHRAEIHDDHLVVLAISIIGVSILMGVACFLVPLWGIHGRLTAEKATLTRGVNLRAQALEEELFRRVDGSTLTGVKDVTDALGGIHATRDQIVKLPTWPWPPQVLRGFISAILLPVVVFIPTRYVGSQLL